METLMVKKARRTKAEYLDGIKALFCEYVILNCEDFRTRSYGDTRFEDHINNFIRDVRGLGLEFSNVYHAHGIGNNNEYTIYLESVDEDGFSIQKNVAILHYCIGLCGGVGIDLRDAHTKETIYQLAYAR